MKLKVLSAIISLICMSTAWGETEKSLDCSNKVEYAFLSMGTGLGAAAHLVYNYSAAYLICPLATINVMENRGTMKCYSSWNIDDRLGNDSLAWAEIVNTGKEIFVRTQTNRVYGSKHLKLDCEFKQNAVQN